MTQPSYLRWRKPCDVCEGEPRGCSSCRDRGWSWSSDLVTPPEAEAVDLETADPEVTLAYDLRGKLNRTLENLRLRGFRGCEEVRDPVIWRPD